MLWIIIVSVIALIVIFRTIKEVKSIRKNEHKKLNNIDESIASYALYPDSKNVEVMPIDRRDEGSYRNLPGENK